MYIRIAEDASGKWHVLDGRYETVEEASTPSLFEDLPEFVVVHEAYFYGYEDLYQLEDADGVENA